MDLLGDYDSSSSTSDDDEEGPHPKQTSKTSAAEAEAVVATTKVKSVGGSNKVADKSNPVKSEGFTNSLPSKKGKKILSLSAVLPQHILDQLTRAEAESDSDSSDDQYFLKPPMKESTNNDGDDNNNDTKASHNDDKNKMTFSSSKNPKDSSLSTLLQELHNTQIKSSKPIARIQQQSHHQQQKDTKPQPTNTVLGAAFVTNFQTTTRRAKGTIIDIHGPNSKPPAETVPSSFNQGPNNNNGSNDDNDNDNSSSGEDGDYDINQSKTTAQISQSLQFNSRTVRSSMPVVRAAPRVSATPVVPHATASSYPQQPQNTLQYNHHQRQNIPQQQRPTNSQPTRKMSRKRQMEQMLRSGNIGDVQEDVQLEAHDASNYTLEESPAHQQHQSQHGLRVVPVGMYDTKAGATNVSVDISSKQKSKHQLNSLLASAASLETHRSQNPMSQTNNGKVHRANAKRKYGW